MHLGSSVVAHSRHFTIQLTLFILYDKLSPPPPFPPFSTGIIFSVTHAALMTWVVRLYSLDGILTAKELVIYPHPNQRPLILHFQ
jgi:hypothetical protein